LALVAASIVSTVVLLGIGTAVGYRFGLRVGSRIEPALHPGQGEIDCSQQLQLCRELADLMEHRCRNVVELAASRRESLPRSFEQALDELVEVTQRLSRQLQSFGDTPLAAQSESPTCPPSNRGLELTAKAIEWSGDTPTNSSPPTELVDHLTGEEIGTFTKPAAGTSDSARDSVKTRHSYDRRQTVYAQYDDDAQGSTEPGVTVRCHDISVQGISFFWPQAPDFTKLIISLGSEQKPVFMAAQIAHSKAVFMHGEAQYLVGCRFTRRVPDFSELYSPPMCAGGRVTPDETEAIACG
jgi:hypothetical protein